MPDGRSAERIVVGVDGSDASIEALREAQRLARFMGAEVEAITCWEFPHMHDGYAIISMEGFRMRVGRVLDDAVEKAFGYERPGNVRARLVSGKAGQVLTEASNGALMLVVGGRNRRRLGKLLIGSVRRACVAHARCPVIVVKAPEFGQRA